jgi:adenosine deaminase
MEEGLDGLETVRSGRRDPDEDVGSVIAHLHLHLEPEERKRALLGFLRREYRTREQFFDAHRIGNGDRVAVDGADLTAFLEQVHAEQRAQGVDYVELRLSPRRFISDGMGWAEFFRLSDATLTGFADPTIRAVLLLNRDSTARFVEECREHVEHGLPSTFVGVDLAGDELSFPDTNPFRKLFGAARAEGLGVTVHAGEFGDLTDIWRAIDELGALRIGHGLAATASAALTDRLRRDAILVETSLSSNLTFGAVASLSDHPLRELVERDVPVCLNTDVPLHTGGSLHDEVAMAAELLGVCQDEILRLQARAERFIFARQEGHG